MQKKTAQNLSTENAELRGRLEELQETLDAIRRGEVDGLVVPTPKGEQVFTLSGAEKPYRVLIEEMREGAVMLSNDNTILYCNRGLAKMLKSPMEKIVGSNIESLVCPTHRAAFKKMLNSARATEDAVTKEITLQAEDGTLVPSNISINTVQTGKITTTFLVVTNLTEHMEAEVKRYTTELELAQIALAESEERWAITLESIGDAVIATDASGKITFMNGTAEQLTGWTLKEATRKPVHEIFKIINQQTHKKIEDPVARVLSKGIFTGLANHTILIRKDKTEVPIDDSGAPIKNKDGKIMGAVLIFRDITERKKTEKETQRLNAIVQQERDRLSSLLNSITDEVWFADTKKKLTLANPSAIKEFKLDSLGIDDVENIASSFEVYRSDGTPRPVEEAPPLRALKGEVLTNHEEIVKTPASGELRVRQVSAAPVRDNNGKIVGSVSVVRDITELKRLQERLQKYSQDLEKLVEERTKQLKDAERLAAIGQTAGMVGHDIRNPLQSILSELYLAKAELSTITEAETKENLLENITNVENEINYINKIVQDLQDFARPIKPIAQEIDLQTICEEILLKNSIPKNIKATCKIQPEAKKIMADPDAMKRIIANLVTNAVQAMPKGGQLNLKASREPEGTVITIQDTGTGIPDEVKKKLFTPLFTTKAKGQGFGLPVVKRMTEALGGTVEFESEVGKGTTFTVRLPLPKELNGKWKFKQHNSGA
jgi:PAS domain S-box-containing protein